MKGRSVRLAVTNEERFALASMLVPSAWGAPEDVLVHFLAAHDAFALEEYRPLFAGVDTPSDHPLASPTTKREVAISNATALTLLSFWPNHATPGLLGPAKVRLLKRLRALAKPGKGADGDKA